VQQLEFVLTHQAVPTQVWLNFSKHGTLVNPGADTFAEQARATQQLLLQVRVARQV
jgi:hypothetical protein